MGPSTWNGLPLELRLLSRPLSLSFFSHLKTVLFRSAGAGRWSNFLEGALYKCSIWGNEWKHKIAYSHWKCMYLTKTFIISINPLNRYQDKILLMGTLWYLPASYWCLVLKLQLGSVAHSPLLVPPPGMDSPWKSVSCLKITKVRFTGCLRLICVSPWLGWGRLWVDFLKGCLINSQMNFCLSHSQTLIRLSKYNAFDFRSYTTPHQQSMLWSIPVLTTPCLRKKLYCIWSI